MSAGKADKGDYEFRKQWDDHMLKLFGEFAAVGNRLDRVDTGLAKVAAKLCTTLGSVGSEELAEHHRHFVKEFNTFGITVADLIHETLGNLTSKFSTAHSDAEKLQDEDKPKETKVGLPSASHWQGQGCEIQVQKQEGVRRAGGEQVLRVA